MRHGGAAKQRIWLGPGRYFCGCERRIAHADAYGDRNSNRRCDRDTNSNCRCDSDTNTNSHSDSNTNSYAYSYCHSYSDFDAESDAHTKIWAIGEASSDSGASSIVSRPIGNA